MVELTQGIANMTIKQFTVMVIALILFAFVNNLIKSLIENDWRTKSLREIELLKQVEQLSYDSQDKIETARKLQAHILNIVTKGLERPDGMVTFIQVFPITCVMIVSCILSILVSILVDQVSSFEEILVLGKLWAAALFISFVFDFIIIIVRFVIFPKAHRLFSKYKDIKRCGVILNAAKSLIPAYKERLKYIQHHIAEIFSTNDTTETQILRVRKLVEDLSSEIDTIRQILIKVFDINCDIYPSTTEPHSKKSIKSSQQLSDDILNAQKELDVISEDLARIIDRLDSLSNDFKLPRDQNR